MECNRRIQSFMLFAGALATATTANAGTVVDFEDILLPSSTSAGDYYNGSDGAGGFTSRGVDFNNNYDAGFGSWSGWGASNSTDTTTAGFTNQYSAFSGSGAEESETFGVAFNFAPGVSVTTFPQPTEVTGFCVTNGTFSALSMLNGDSFAKQFGGTSGNDPDWFKLAVFGKDDSNNTTGTVDFYLADYRFSDNNQDYVVDDWVWVDLTSLGTHVQSLEFELTSSDNGMFGMNTPAFFLIDNLTITVPPDDADFNHDLAVDGVDLTTWESNFGLAGGVTRHQGDANGDLDVDGYDFLVWQRQFDPAGSLSLPQEIPEPRSLVLALIAFVAGVKLFIDQLV